MALAVRGEPIGAVVTGGGGGDPNLVAGAPRGIPAGPVPGDLLGAHTVELAGFDDPETYVGGQGNGAPTDEGVLVDVLENQTMYDASVSWPHAQRSVDDDIALDRDGGVSVRVEGQRRTSGHLEAVRVVVVCAGERSGHGC